MRVWGVEPVAFTKLSLRMDLWNREKPSQKPNWTGVY